jgi:AcrR family transcriptional regulator
MSSRAKRAKPATPDAPSAVKFIDRYAAQLTSGTFTSKGERTRFRLKIAAVKLLEKSGFQNLRVSDIASEAGLALGTFYVYFTDKAAIASDVMIDFGDDLYRRAQLIAHGRHDFEAVLVTNRFFVVNYKHNAGLVRCLFQLDDLLPEFSARWRERRHQWMEGIARSIARRSGNPNAPRSLSLPVAFALEGLIVQYLVELFIKQNSVLNKFRQSPDEIAEMLSVLWYRAVYCEDPPAEMVRKAKGILALRRREAARPPLKTVETSEAQER